LDEPHRHPVGLVTGAAGAIGSATARRLAADGYAVVLNDVRESALDELAARIDQETGRRVMACAADISDEQQVEAMFADVRRLCGRLDVLVNNAGVLRNAPVTEMSAAQWNCVLDVHLTGAFLCSRAAVPLMIEGGGGRIVNLSSGAVRGSARGHANYASAKAGLLGLTTALATELGPHGITVNAVAPGAIRSEMTRETAAQIGQDFDTYVAEVSAGVPLRRLGEPDDVADVVSFFARPGSYVTGQVLFVAGGP
jgi:3-oxoacyl-[acyl-carrier protein] reductase